MGQLRFAALADDTRRGILARLAEGQATVNQLAEPYSMSLQANSRHLQMLERAGLVGRGRSAQRRPSWLEVAPLIEVDEWIATFRGFWSPGGAGVTITRVFDAPPQQIWSEWTEPARLAGWFGAPEAEVPPSTVSIDLVPGGRWQATTLGFGPDGHDVRWSGEHLEVAPPERLAFTICGLAKEDEPDVVTVTLAELGRGRAEMLFRHYGQRAPAEWEVARVRWSAEFDRISDRLARRAG